MDKHKIKTSRRVIKLFKNRALLIGLLIFLQVLFLFAFVWSFSEYFIVLYILAMLLSSILTIALLYDRRTNPAYKISLIVALFSVPVLGAVIFLIYTMDRRRIRSTKSIAEYQKLFPEFLPDDSEFISKIAETDKSVLPQLKYISHTAHYPIYEDTQTQYFPLGELMFESLKNDLRSAERFIFMEYFIIEEGKMWGEILEILVEKVKQGVDVRVMYDDIGCVQTLPTRYFKYLRSLGIKCHVFNRFNPVVSMVHNHRDHRKITVIDGHTAYTGGINLADEYINDYVKHGHWKDVAVRLYGKATWSFTVMFLSLWCPLTKTKEDFEKYKPEQRFYDTFKSDGYVQPFDDVPIDDEIVGENVYLNMINRAENYVYICSPYFIVDNETISALCTAAKSGVDVRIITPHLGDKWYVHAMTRSYYSVLVENGVKVYEYTDGFIHAKSMVCDDKLAVIGTINFDFRSLYLTFECATLLYKTNTVTDIYNDFLKTVKISQLMTKEIIASMPWYKKVGAVIFSIFAPLM